MEPRGFGKRWLCLALLCSGAALASQEEEPGNQSVVIPETTTGDPRETATGDPLETTGDPLETTGDPRETATGDPLETTGDPRETTGPSTTSRDVSTATTSPPRTGDPVSTPTPGRATRNQTRSGSAVPVRYWSPVIFVVVALLVLFFAYHRKKGEGSRDQAVPASDSSDLGVLHHAPAHDTTPIIAAPQGERKVPEPPPAPDDTETAFSEPDPPRPQPDSPPAAGGSGDPGAD